MKKRFAGIAAVFLAAVLVLPCSVDAVSAKKAILLDACTGRVLYQKRMDDRALIASTTKIMTALIVCEQCNVLDRMEIPKEAVGIEGSSMYLQEGEVLTIQELLYGLMLRSGNDAAVALAIYCGGTVEGFASLMNDKAHRLGLLNTHFENPHGLDSPGHYSTAHDMAKLSAYAMQNPIFAKVVSTKSITMGERSLRNHNKLLWSLEGADGVKTGFTKAAGRILVSSVLRQDRRLVCVTMNAPGDWMDHTQLMEYGFQKFSVKQLVEKGDCLGQIEIAGGTAGSVPVLADSSFSFPLAADEQVEIIVPGCGFVYAPVAEGQTAGYAYVCVDGNSVGKVPLIFGSTVEQNNREKPSFWKRFFGGE